MFGDRNLSEKGTRYIHKENITSMLSVSSIFVKRKNKKINRCGKARGMHSRDKRIWLDKPRH